MTTALIITLILIMMQKKETSLAIIAIVAALGLLGVVVVEIISTPQHQAEARGCTNSQAFNASKGRCFGH
jgi:hypothetical protein